MKKLLSILFCVLVAVSMTLPAFATETEPVEPEMVSEPETVPETVTEPETLNEPVIDPVTVDTGDSSQVVVNVNVPAQEEPAPGDEVEEEFIEPSVATYSMTTLGDTGTEDETLSLPLALESLFGKYEPRTQTVTEVLSDGSTIEYEQYVPGVAGMDWDWIASVSLFSMALYCVFRAIGGCLKCS